MSYKTALEASLDVSALSMDCLDINKILDKKLNKILSINRTQVSAEIEGQMKLKFAKERVLKKSDKAA